MMHDISLIIKTRIGVADLAKALLKSPYTIRKMARAGKLPGAKKIGRDWSFEAEKVNRFLSRY